jgi:hypothetical protein
MGDGVSCSSRILLQAWDESWDGWEENRWGLAECLHRNPLVQRLDERGSKADSSSTLDAKLNPFISQCPPSQ